MNRGLFLIGILMSAIVLTISGCSDKKEHEITIALNPWPGYEPLALAETKGFFENSGMNIKLIQLGSLSEVQRAYLNGHIDGMASTLIEVVQVEHLGNRPLKVIMVPDYSNGGDVIVATDEVSSVSQLKGKSVGAEVSSLGIFVLQRALTRHGLTLDDINLVNIEQADGVKKLHSKEIDALVSYPPFSVRALQKKQINTIFTSAEIPNEIIDTISISEELLNSHPNLPQQLRDVWQRTLDAIKSNPSANNAIMADRQGISVEEFEAAITDLVILSKAEQEKLFKEKTLLNSAALAVCNTLTQVNALEADCAKQRELFLPY